MVKSASIVLFTSHDVAALSNTLHGIWETASQPYELVVLASRCDEDVANYLMRQYRRGRVTSFGFEVAELRGKHCGLDRGFPFTTGEYLVRVDDELQFQPDWLQRAVEVMETAPELGVLGLLRPCGKRKRGRPPKVRCEPVVVECVDASCFVTRHELFERHERELMGTRPADSCVYQARLQELGFRLAYLPGLVKRTTLLAPLSETVHGEGGGELPYHGPASGTLQKIEQVYELGEDVLLTCMACGNNELEVVAAKVEFCPRHGVPVGYTYTLRCANCGELQHYEDLQFLCPD